MNKLSTEKRAMILRLLVEGMSMRSITRTVGCSINTVTEYGTSDDGKQGGRAYGSGGGSWRTW